MYTYISWEAAVGNKTIYVKNEELWETARSVAGKDGMSAFIEEALQRLVTVKRLEQKGLQPFSLLVEPIHESHRVPGVTERLGFEGKRLVDWGPFQVYLTKGGTFIVADFNFDEEMSICDYRTYDQLAELREDEAIARVDADQQDILWDQIRHALPPPVVTTWID